MSVQHCNAENAARARRAAAALEDCPSAVGVDVLDPDTGQHGRWSLEATIVDAGLPPEVTGVVAEYGLQLHPQPSQGDLERLVATV